MARGFFGAIIRVLAFCLLSYLLGRGVAILLSSGSVTISSAASPSSVASTANASSPSALPGPSAVLVGKAPIVTTLPAATTSTSTSTTTTTRTTPKVFANDAGVVFSLSPESSASNRVCEIFTSIRNALPSRFPVTVLWPSESFQGFSMCGPQESKGFDTWSVVHQTRDEHSSKYTRGATDIAHATRMISCLKVAPIDWQLVIWLNVTALENASPQVPPPCVLADTESLASLLEVVKDNFGASASMNATALGDSSRERQRLLLWPPGAYGCPLALRDGLDSLAVVRPTPAATSSFPWLSTFEEVYRRHALRYAFPLVQQRHALAEAFLRHPDTLIALPDGKGRKAATTSTWAGLSDRSPKEKPCACRPCTRNEDDQRLLLKITKNRVDAGHTSPPRRRGDGDSANGIGGLQLQLPALHVATEVYEARYEESWTQCSGGVGGCRSSLRRQLQGHDPLHDKASRGYAPYPNRSQARALHLQRRFRVVVVTASSLKSLSDRKTMAMMANKQAYAENHGYVFELGISDVIVAAEGLKATSTVVFKGEFCKILVLLSSMRRHVTADWFMMADHDVWLHPMALKEASLDAWLLAVPPSKLFVHSNYHSLNTGVVFLRQGAAGRELVLEWWAVANSSLIQCHSWDQAAAQLLFLSQLAVRHDNYGRLQRGLSSTTTTTTTTTSTAALLSELDKGMALESPFNFSCQAGRCGNFEKAQFWSCDKAYRDALRRAFGNNERYSAYYQEGKLSMLPATLRANSKATEFFVLRESRSLPRLQCMHCQTIDAIDAPWGFNKPTMHGGLNGWFVTHKAQNRFAQYFTDMSDPNSPFRNRDAGAKEPKSAFKQRTTLDLKPLTPVAGFGFSSCPEPKRGCSW